MKTACRKGSQEFTFFTRNIPYSLTLVNTLVSFEQWI